MTHPIEASGRAESQRRSVTVLVVDDQKSFRDAMRDLVAATRSFTLVGEAVSGEAAIVAVARLIPRLVLMDVRMPGLDGIETARRLTQSHPDLVLILISVESIAGLPTGASSCGAHAFVRKQDLRPRVLRELWAIHGET